MGGVSFVEALIGRCVKNLMRLRSGRSDPKAGCGHKGFIYGQAISLMSLNCALDRRIFIKGQVSVSNR
jgi:hypothetical protein